MKIIQITDTHLSPTKTHFNDNWAPLAHFIESEKPDLVVHTGDLSLDGADTVDDLTFAKDLLSELTMPVLVVPGNHDVGHDGGPQPVNAERLERWRTIVGPDCWSHDRDGWRLIGLNSLVFGVHPQEEAKQLAWLEETLATAGDRQIAMFAHQPLFVDGADEGDSGYWGIKPAPRRTLFDLIAAHNVKLYANGHLHRAWTGTHEKTALVWGPSSAFIIDTLERDMPGERWVGAVVHELGKTVSSTIMRVSGMSAHVIDDVIDEVYPREKFAAESSEAAE
ncbi:metallophosphoesterase [Rhizobium sp. CFBP 8762]|uniref:metallophosphoesterase n=1 Tax=Rhizobium sp. CFBP 8762 TaxID=2775279 RepID=UPI00177B1484|nr:metallophosphoesterase [Rhizobium sp. CFBP 8762]